MGTLVSSDWQLSIEPTHCQFCDLDLPSTNQSFAGDIVPLVYISASSSCIHPNCWTSPLMPHDLPKDQSPN